MATVRRCLGCSATYPADAHACPKCGSHAGELAEVDQAERDTADKPKPRRRKT
jgi:rRNA maturation endonuclease Nob1